MPRCCLLVLKAPRIHPDDLAVEVGDLPRVLDREALNRTLGRHMEHAALVAWSVTSLLLSSFPTPQ
ncbi:MAG: hypothetical protein ISR64_06380 [Deltaproteobacteria bacterium]|nr:hypothetical protein [Deltaproteobacteria bacterium]